MLRTLTPALAALACAVALIACGSASSAEVPGPPPAARTASANPVAVSPQPGTPDASPTTQISFLGGAGTTVSGVTVKGSSSGSHSGVLRAYSTGTGESFIPSKPFREGEKVTVRALLTGGPSTGTVTTSFTVAHQYAPSQKAFPLNPGNAAAVQHYRSAPSLTPSSVRIYTHAKPGAAPGDLFLAPYQGKGTPGPMITDQEGNLVWFQPVPSGESATNFQVVQLGGQPALTWWQGRILEVGFGQGEDVIANLDYQQIGHVRAGNGYHADLHEIRLTPDGTAWIDEFDPIHMNLSSRDGLGDGVITDSVIQQIDLKTGLVMWEWHALGQHPDLGIAQPDSQAAEALGLHPHQLDQPWLLRRRAAVRSQHLDAVRRRHAQRRDQAGAWAARTRTSSRGRGRTSTGSTTPSGSRAV